MAGLDENHGHLFLGITWTGFTLSAVSLAARLYTRWMCGIKIWWDDFWVMITLPCCFGMSVLFSLYALEGGAGQFTISTLSGAQEIAISRLFYIAQPFALAALATGKASVACLIKRLQTYTRWRTILLWTLMSLLVANNLVQIVMLFVQYNQIIATWNPGSTAGAHCMSLFYTNCLALAGASFNAFVDLILVIIPLQMIWGLHISRRRKFVVGALLSTGILPCTMAVIKIDSFFTMDYSLLLIWNACEINSIIIAACIPTLQPLFSAAFGFGSLTRRRLRRPQDRSRQTPSAIRMVLPRFEDDRGS